MVLLFVGTEERKLGRSRAIDQTKLGSSGANAAMR